MEKAIFSLVGIVAVVIFIIGYFLLRWVRERKSGRKLVFHSRK